MTRLIHRLLRRPGLRRARSAAAERLALERRVAALERRLAALERQIGAPDVRSAEEVQRRSRRMNDLLRESIARRRAIREAKNLRPEDLQ